MLSPVAPLRSLPSAWMEFESDKFADLLSEMIEVCPTNLLAISKASSAERGAASAAIAQVRARIVSDKIFLIFVLCNFCLYAFRIVAL